MLTIRIVNAVLAVLFLLSMAVQFNDPDPVFWVATYGSVAVIAGFAVFAKFYVPLIVITFVICLGGSLYLMPSVIELFLHHHPSDLINRMSADKPYIEGARESLGLLISAVALTYFFVLARMVRKKVTGAEAGDG